MAKNRAARRAAAIRREGRAPRTNAGSSTNPVNRPGSKYACICTDVDAAHARDEDAHQASCPHSFEGGMALLESRSAEVIEKVVSTYEKQFTMQWAMMDAQLSIAEKEDPPKLMCCHAKENLEYFEGQLTKLLAMQAAVVNAINAGKPIDSHVLQHFNFLVSYHRRLVARAKSQIQRSADYHGDKVCDHHGKPNQADDMADAMVKMMANLLGSF